MIPVEVLQRFEGPPQWGVNDCAHFAGGVWEHYTGWNPSAAFSYATEQEAADIIHTAGSMEALVSSVLGVSRGPEYARMAKDGDVALAAGPGVGPILGVVSGYKFLVRGPLGFIPLKLDKAVRFWPCHSSSR